MDPISIAASSIAVLQAGYSIVVAITGAFSTARFIARTYGIAGLWITVLGSKDVMRSEFEILASDNDQIATNFKKATQDESSMIAVASTIAAQIAITALSLVDLSETHWTPRGLFSISLVSSIIAVYYVSNQYRTIGRCLSASQIKSWITNEEVSTSAVLYRFLSEEAAFEPQLGAGGVYARPPTA
ncbi:hypothetical protein B0T24DRAFT_706975 [Lasiosphaeria ovina]|uniref:Uncharacterized protein n=1 Tax=Lasiosphaeria ovina TaxID=92902 RepID=A0AAE0K3B2_9PEZI|nr:hypothetical protein B0T24DRAFT_706975 [Lasiosphaeria ovina]